MLEVIAFTSLAEVVSLLAVETPTSPPEVLVATSIRPSPSLSRLNPSSAIVDDLLDAGDMGTLEMKGLVLTGQLGCWG